MKKQKKQHCRPRCNAGYMIEENKGVNKMHTFVTVKLNPRKRWAWYEMTRGRIKAWRGSVTLYMNEDEFDRIFQTKQRDVR